MAYTEPSERVATEGRLVQRIRELEAEVQRLKVWGSEFLNSPGWPHDYGRGGIHKSPCRGCLLADSFRAALTPQEER